MIKELPVPLSWREWLMSLPIERFKAKDEKPPVKKPKFGDKRVA